MHPWPPLLSPRAPAPAQLERVHAGQQDAAPTAAPPPGGGACNGWRHVARSTRLGGGEDLVGRVAVLLRAWAAHRGAGVRVHPPAVLLEPGATVVLDAPIAGLHAVVACRVLEVQEQPGRFRFSYAALPHHLIEGEEHFLVEALADGGARFSVSAWLRPRASLLRPASSLVAALDAHLVRRYVAAVARSPRGRG